MNRTIKLSLCAAALALAPMASQAADADAKPLTVHQSSKKGTVAGGRAEQVTATVTAVDVAARKVTLKGPKGKEDVIKVGDEVKNLDQVKVGDLVVVTFSQGVVLSLAAPGAAAVAPTATATGAAAAPGEKPAADVKATIKGTVTIAAIDAKTRVVTLVGPEGRKFKVTAGKEIPLEKVKVGDKVNAEYTEAVAVAVEPAPKKAAKKPAKKAAN
jgi:Cu/Ag efflux protein CusF